MCRRMQFYHVRSILRLLALPPLVIIAVLRERREQGVNRAPLLVQQLST